MILRPYQRAAIDAINAYWQHNDGNPLLVLPTGSGKSVIQAEFVREVLDAYPNERLLLLTHVKELIEQNASKIKGASIYSAGLGQREWGQVTVAGIQSVYKRAHEAGNVGIVIIDECFVGGTKILMGDGSSRAIEKIRPGDFVISHDKRSHLVEAVSASTSQRLVDILTSSHHVIKCTEDHPFLTADGWKKAKDLNHGDEIVRVVRREIRKQVQELGEVLQQRVWPKSEIKKVQSGDDRDAQTTPRCCKIGQPENEKKEPDAQKRNTREGVEDTEGDGVGSSCKKRERDGANQASVNFDEFAWVGGRVPHPDQDQEGKRIPDLLQSGPCQPEQNGCGGDRRAITPIDRKKGAGQKEGRFAFVYGLVGVESVERCRDGESRESCKVYNLQVKGTHTYALADSGAIVHNCHLVSKTSNTMYRRFLAELRELCPKVKVLGMSATPYRLDSGPLHKGEDRIFTDIAYEVTIKELIDQGHLAPLVSAPTEHHVDTSQVKKRGGEYITGDLEQAMLGTTDDALTEAGRLAGDRKSWLVFCVGVEHAKEVKEAMRKRGHRAAVVLGDTPAYARAQVIDDFRTGDLTALISVGVLTTGFDAPNADAIMCLRPTMSPGLWVQLVGRGSRTYAGKKDCLVLDFTDNTYRHGPVDLISIDGDGNVKTCPYRICDGCGELCDPREKVCPKCGHKRVKTCANCQNQIDVDATKCPECGARCVRPREAKHGKKAARGTLISANGWREVEVESWQFWEHRKEGKPPSMRVEYYCTNRKEPYRQWLCFQHGGYATDKALDWWQWLGNEPAPVDTAEALSRVDELRMPPVIQVKRGKNGYWEVK